MKRTRAILAGVVILIVTQPIRAGMISLPLQDASANSVAPAAAPQELTAADSEMPSISLSDLVFQADWRETVRDEPTTGAGVHALQDVATNWRSGADGFIDASYGIAIWPELYVDLVENEPSRDLARTAQVVEPTSFVLLLLGLAGFGLHRWQKARKSNRQPR